MSPIELAADRLQSWIKSKPAATFGRGSWGVGLTMYGPEQKCIVIISGTQGQQATLTIAEARQLYEALKEAFGGQS